MEVVGTPGSHRSPNFKQQFHKPKQPPHYTVPRPTLPQLGLKRVHCSMDAIYKRRTHVVQLLDKAVHRVVAIGLEARFTVSWQVKDNDPPVAGQVFGDHHPHGLVAGEAMDEEDGGWVLRRLTARLHLGLSLVVAVTELLQVEELSLQAGNDVATKAGGRRRGERGREEGESSIKLANDSLITHTHTQREKLRPLIRYRAGLSIHVHVMAGQSATLRSENCAREGLSKALVRTPTALSMNTITPQLTVGSRVGRG